MKKLLILLLSITSLLSYANEADIINVKVEPQGSELYRFHVTLKHDDEGWDHYANKWEVITPNGEVIATRILHHPHVNEQPFTRSLSNINIPSSIPYVIVKAYDSVHGDGGIEKTVDLSDFNQTFSIQ